MQDAGWRRYRKRTTIRMRPYIPGEDLRYIDVYADDIPEIGGMIAMSTPENLWYVSKEDFERDYELVR